MLKLIAEIIKYYDELIVRLKAKQKTFTNKEDKAYYQGLIIAYSNMLDTLKSIQREYEVNVQSVEESMRFLRGE